MSRTFKTPKGTELPLMDIKGKPYLSVQHRIMWFREDHPDWCIETNIIYYDPDHTIASALIKDSAGRILATGHKREDKQGFADHYEKAESGAIGRALGFLGYGTAFALDLEEGQRLADAPTNETEKKKDGPSMTVSGRQKTTSGISQTQEAKSNIEVNQADDAASLVCTFGKYKDMTVKEAIDKDGQFKIASYCQWLESDAKAKKKPISESAQDFIDAFNAFVGHSELDKALEATAKPKDKSILDQLNRLKNQFPGVPGPKMPVPYKDDEAPPIEWDPNEEIPF